MGRVDMTGQRFGKLVAIRHVGLDKDKKHSLWECKCDCGQTTIQPRGALIYGRSVSCGCVSKTRLALRTKHGHATSGFHSGTHRSWYAMIQRCAYPSHRAWKWYGGRGIKVCDRWLGTQGFINFLSDMGERPKGMTIDRKNVNGDYEPDNCKWATWSEQSSNRRKKSPQKNCSTLTVSGVTKPLIEWCKEFGLNYSTVKNRKYRGWPEEECVLGRKKKHG